LGLSITYLVFFDIYCTFGQYMSPAAAGAFDVVHAGAVEFDGDLNSIFETWLDRPNIKAEKRPVVDTEPIAGRIVCDTFNCAGGFVGGGAGMGEGDQGVGIVAGLPGAVEVDFLGAGCRKKIKHNNERYC